MAWSALSAQSAVGSCVDFKTETNLYTPKGHLSAQFETDSNDGLSVLRVTPKNKNADAIVVLPLPQFMDGEIKFRFKSGIKADASSDARGFAGLAFRLNKSHTEFEYFYVRPGNSRSDDQVRRNHTIQYAAYPHYPWEILRKSDPEKYESYADIGLDEWMEIRALIRGKTALFYINGAKRPSLVVKDLKIQERQGEIAIWVGPGTVAEFANACGMK